MESTTIKIQFPKVLIPDLEKLSTEAETTRENFVCECAQVVIAARRMADLPVPEPPDPEEPEEEDDDFEDIEDPEDC
jgi:hypothetical protein